MTFGYFFLHLGMLATRFLGAPDKKAFLLGPRSMVPQPKDLEDVVGMFRWLHACVAVVRCFPHARGDVP